MATIISTASNHLRILHTHLSTKRTWIVTKPICKMHLTTTKTISPSLLFCPLLMALPFLSTTSTEFRRPPAGSCYTLLRTFWLLAGRPFLNCNWRSYTIRLKNLAGNVGDMSAKCWQYVKMSMNLGIFACGCRHQNLPDTKFLCQKFSTLSPIPERTYAQRSNALPKILTLETDYVWSDATSFVIAIELHRHHNSNWSCSTHPPVITSCRFDINFDCCVCSHDHLLAAVCIASVL